MCKFCSKQGKAVIIACSLQFISANHCINKKRDEIPSKLDYSEILIGNEHDRNNEKDLNKTDLIHNNNEKDLNKTDLIHNNNEKDLNKTDLVHDKSKDSDLAFIKNNMDDQKFKEILTEYIVDDNVAKLEELLNLRKKPEEDINIRDDRGRAILHYAVCLSKTSLIEKLITKYKADVNVLSNNSRRTPLHYACANPEAIKILLRHKANIRIKDINKLTPLDYAINRRKGYKNNSIMHDTVQESINLLKNTGNNSLFDCMNFMKLR